MKKDVIYIDIEDDITSIIDKVQQAANKIVALVPPKRVGVLQSVVNLKLLQKAADTQGKHIVLITSDSALTALAAGIRIPIAKNLQSKPEMAVAAAPETDDEDIINGDELPVGELAQTAGESAAVAPLGLGAAAQQASKEVAASEPAKFSAIAASGTPKKSGMKIPNFESFRKRLFLIVSASVVLIAFLVWAIVFAPRATVAITAKTNPIDIKKDLILDPAAEPDVSLGRLKPETQQIKKTATTEFDATGSKEVGNKATGTLTLKNEDGQSVTVPAGTVFSAQSLQFVSVADATVPAASICARSTICPGTAKVGITAAAIGPEYNIGAQAYTTDEPVSAATETATSGGSKETVKVVAQADIDKAIQQVGNQNTAAVSKELAQQFKGDFVIIKESYLAQPSQPRPEPAIGEQAQRGRLTIETTYSLVGIERSQVKNVLNQVLKASIENEQQQRIYSSGDQSIVFSNYQSGENNVAGVSLSTTGQIGPSIDAKALASQLVGKRYGEIEQIVNNIDGVEKVDINFSPFWVSKAPSQDKVTVKFNVKTNAN